MPLKLIEDSSNSFDIICFVVINQNVIQVNNSKDVQFCYQYSVDILLEACQCIEKAKRHHLIPKMTVSYTKSYLLLFIFTNFNPVIGTSQMDLDNLRFSKQPIQGLSDQIEQVPFLDGHIMRTLIIDAQVKTVIRFLDKKNQRTCGRFKGSYEIVNEFGFYIANEGLLPHRSWAIDRSRR